MWAGRDQTDQAIVRGARLALNELGNRAGRFRVDLGDRTDSCAAWIGSGESFHLRGDHQPATFCVSAFDSWPLEPTGCFRVTPGFDQQGGAAAAWMKKSGATRIALIVDRDSSQSQGIASGFEAGCRQLGLPLVEQVYTSPRSESLDLVLAARPGLVFYSGEVAPYARTHQIFSALRAKGYAGTLATGDADPGVSFLATRPDLVDGAGQGDGINPRPPRHRGVLRHESRP